MVERLTAENVALRADLDRFGRVNDELRGVIAELRGENNRLHHEVEVLQRRLDLSEHEKMLLQQQLAVFREEGDAAQPEVHREEALVDEVPPEPMDISSSSHSDT